MRLSTILLGVLLSLSCNNNQQGGTRNEASPPINPSAKVAPPTSAGATSQAPSATGASGSPPGAQASASGAPIGSAPPSASAASSASPVATHGLDAPKNHTEVVSMARDILKYCKWERDAWKTPCKSLDELMLWFSPGHVVVQDTVLEFCSDRDPRARALCSLILEFDSLQSISDKAQASALLDAFEKERSAAACTGMARAIDYIDAEKTGNEERIQQLLKSHPVARCREAMLEHFLVLSSSSHRYDSLVNLARTDPSPATRSAAVRGLGNASFSDTRWKNSCKVWLEVVDESGHEYAGLAAALLAQKDVCEGQWDDLLKKVDAMIAAGKAVSPVEDVTCHLPWHKKVKAEQKSLAMAMAKKIVENEKNPGPMRAKALACVGQYDPEGKAFAAKFVDASAAEVKKTAAKLTEAKP